MAEILVFITAPLGTIAALITIMQFFGLRTFLAIPKSVQFSIIVACTAILLSTWYYIEKKNEKNNIEKIKSELMKDDAKSVSSAIVISGWENSGYYIGCLTNIVGFYGRHKDFYNEEYEKNKVQLDDYISFFKEKRDENKYVSSLEWEGLKGLVQLGKNNLEKIWMQK